MVAEAEQARVLIVSASPYTRYVISGELGSEPDLFVVGTARTPDEISYKQTLLQPDLLVVDLESSQDLLDLQQSLTQTELPTLALCAHTRSGAELALAALEAGVTDVVARSDGGLGVFDFRPDLLRKVRGLARIGPCVVKRNWTALMSRDKTSPQSFLPGDRVIVVSTSTGGFDPLVQFLVMLPADLRAALLVLSLLPSNYLRLFLRRISPATTFRLRQARDGLSLKRGMAYFVPYEYALAVGSRGYLTLDCDLRRREVRPSANATMASLAVQYGPAVIGVILSGIGDDGVKGALDVRAAGGTVVVQEPATCVAGETPAAVIQAGAATVVLPPDQIVEDIGRRTGKAG